MKNLNLVRLSLIVISIMFIIYGIFRNEVQTVFSKSIRLCLECVGIG